MSVSAISSSNTYPVQNYQSQFQKVKNDFQQLGKDLQSGNLSQAQADFATLQSDRPAGQSSSSSPVSNDLNNLGQALQSGNLSQAQQAYSSVQQDVQQNVQQGGGHHHHHHHGGGGHDSSQGASATQSELSQAFTDLGKQLQAGNLSAAQQAYATIQTDLQQFGSTSGTNNSSTTQPAQAQPQFVSTVVQ